MALGEFFVPVILSRRPLDPLEIIAEHLCIPPESILSYDVIYDPYRLGWAFSNLTVKGYVPQLAADASIAVQEPPELEPALGQPFAEHDGIGGQHGLVGNGEPADLRLSLPAPDAPDGADFSGGYAAGQHDLEGHGHQA